MTDRIVVGFDGSDGSSSAARWAISEAGHVGGAVRVIRAFSVDAVSAGQGRGIEPATSDPAAHVAVCVRQLRATLAAADETEAAAEIEVKGRGARLIAIGSTGAGLTTRRLLGCVCAGLLGRSARPVVVVPKGLREVDLGKVVAAVDGSPSSDAAVLWATDESNCQPLRSSSRRRPLKLSSRRSAMGCQGR